MALLPHQPRTALATHRIANQAAPLADVNLFTADKLLRTMTQAAGAAPHLEQLRDFGARVGSEEVQYWGEQANRNPPQLRAFDRYGQRIDEVEFHPAYHALMKLGLEAGTSAIAWTAPAAGHVAHSVLLYLMTQADAGVGCPMSMTYAAVPALRHDAELLHEWLPRVTAAAYDERCIPAAHKRGCTLGMAMTEKQGGSDVRANSTVAIEESDGAYLLRGHKWFCSAPMSDGFLTLAKVDGDDGALTCFFAPKWRPDGTRNAIEIQRLKDKLGDRSNASSEIEYRDAYAERLGAVGQGVRTIIEMVQHTRLDCITGAAATMRIAVSQALWHAERRSAFGRKLIDQPLMRAVLADLTLEAAAATALSLRVARAFDQAAGDEQEAALLRIATPVAKYWVCKRCPAVAAEAMECLGGIGYVEEAPLARLYRQAPLNGIWEGSGNVIALDVLRAIGREPAVLEALARELRSDGISAGLAQPVAELLIDGLRRAEEQDARSLTETAAILLAARALAALGFEELAVLYLRHREQMPSLSFGASLTQPADVARLLDCGRLAA
jgi:putative acyl-CoA dehydrogenase